MLWHKTNSYIVFCKAHIYLKKFMNLKFKTKLHKINVIEFFMSYFFLLFFLRSEPCSMSKLKKSTTFKKEKHNPSLSFLIPLLKIKSIFTEFPLWCSG